MNRNDVPPGNNREVVALGPEKRPNYLRLWIVLGVVVIASFIILAGFGGDLYHKAPPVPNRVVTPDGHTLFTAADIRDGQNVWQSMGGQEVGSVWGHGAYVAPDWTADYLHRQCLFLLERWAQRDAGKPFADLPTERQAALRARLVAEVRTNTYDPNTGAITLSPDRAAAADAMARYYDALFSDAPEFPPDLQTLADGGKSPHDLRDDYAIPANSVPDPHRRHLMADFFWWATWACSTERPSAAATPTAQLASASIALPDAASANANPRPGAALTPVRPVTYTNNWPAEPLIDNAPSGPIVVWSVISFVLLLAGIATLAWYYAVLHNHPEPQHPLPHSDPLLALSPTPSMQATLKYFWVVAALIVVQVGLGAVTAHYGVEGSGFYGFPLADWLPYSVTRTWHTQLGIFWIATAWLATGLFVAPAVSGYEPKFQRAGVNLLFVCLLLIVLGSMFGTWLGTRQRLGFTTNFWFGHQGFEYVDLGRFWQLFLFIGLLLWLWLMARAMWPAFHQPGEHRHLLALFLLASAAIWLFYGAGLMWGRQTNLAIAEYWRWWVVHLWVEGFFEVFATVVIAFLFTRMGLLQTRTAAASVLFSTAIFLAGGIVGTFHHLYFTGTPTAVLALGATFSAMEVVPLVLIGFEAYENLTLSRAQPWVAAYRWPIYFFVAVAFWNLVGAGLFGFLINPPVALYYMQGLNTTPVHGHTALFGVYGMLGIGLMLFCLKGLTLHNTWRTGALAFSFWAINIGLALMVLISILPVGLLQTWASVEHGMWYARSAQFLHAGPMDTLRWLRVIGDTIFAVGILVLGYFILGLKTGWSLASTPDHFAQPIPHPPETPGTTPTPMPH